MWFLVILLVFFRIFILSEKIKIPLASLSFTISHIYREGNACADWLANFGAQSYIFQEHPLNNLPTPLRGMICLEKLGLPYIHHAWCFVLMYVLLNVFMVCVGMLRHPGFWGLMVILCCFFMLFWGVRGELVMFYGFLGVLSWCQVPFQLRCVYLMLRGVFSNLIHYFNYYVYKLVNVGFTIYMISYCLSIMGHIMRFLLFLCMWSWRICFTLPLLMVGTIPRIGLLFQRFS